MKTLETRFFYSLGTAVILLMLLGSVDGLASHLMTVGVLSLLLVVNAVYSRYLYVLMYRQKNAEERATERAKRHAENTAEVASFNPNRVA